MEQVIRWFFHHFCRVTQPLSQSVGTTESSLSYTITVSFSIVFPTPGLQVLAQKGDSVHAE